MTNYNDELGCLTFDQLLELIDRVGGPRNVPKILSGEIRVILESRSILKCSNQFDPVAFIGDKYSYWRGSAEGNGLEGDVDQDERSVALERIDWSQVTFTHCLLGDEKSISGEEKIKRLKQTGHILFGANVFLSLWTDYQANKQNSVIEWLYHTNGLTCLDFLGTILRDEEGHRYIIYMYRDDGEWRWSCWGSLEKLKWEAHNLSGVLPNDLHPNEPAHQY